MWQSGMDRPELGWGDDHHMHAAYIMQMLTEFTVLTEWFAKCILEHDVT